MAALTKGELNELFQAYNNINLETVALFMDFLFGTGPGSNTGNLVPYTGATKAVNLGSQNLVANRLSLGTANPILSSNIYIGSPVNTVADFQCIFLETTAAATTTTAVTGYTSRIGTAAASFTLPNLYHFAAGKGPFGAGSTVTNQYGFFAGNITGATNNYSFYAQNAAAANTYNLYMAGTALNFMGGNLGMNVTNPVAWIGIGAPSAAKAQINLATGTAPSAPADGDIWREDNTNTGLKIRVNGVTKTFTLA